MADATAPPKRPPPPGLMALLAPYRRQVFTVIVLTILANSLNLLVPRLIAWAVDRHTEGAFVLSPVLWEFLAVAVGIFALSCLQNVAQVFASERVARDLRTRLASKISRQNHLYVQELTAARLLTNLTSDVDAVKGFISMAMPSIVSSLFLIVGASVMLLTIDWELALAVLVVLPVIGGSFAFVMARVRKLFRSAQEAVDRLNKVINESIRGSALIRLLYTQHLEFDKFVAANAEARDISLSILRLFASLIPIIMFATNLATLTILVLGGRLVILGDMSVGDFLAFNSYLGILIFPVIVIGFMSNVMAQASASYGRIAEVLGAPEHTETGTIDRELKGDIAIRGLSLAYGGKDVLRGVDLELRAGTRNAVIGPTAAGKTQLLYLLTGLLKASSGTIALDGRNVADYTAACVHSQIGFVFQDSVLFNLSLRENIAFSRTATDADLEKAIDAAELRDFVESLPEKLDTVVSERGTNLSGGQKQRIMLARALTLNPRILLLDDFTARVDAKTEQRILANVHRFYPGITLLSVTQKVASMEHYDQIVLLMEGEVLARGTHPELMAASPEYVQIYESQRSTSHYEVVRAE